VSALEAPVAEKGFSSFYYSTSSTVANLEVDTRLDGGWCHDVMSEKII
jgi:hypothetical protein